MRQGSIPKGHFSFAKPARVCVLLGFTLLIVFNAAQASAANRAFVVGNSNYAHAQHLPNPRNDAGDVAQALTGLGYRVTLGLDLSRTDFLAKFQAFNQSLRPDDLALFYYAGHGIQIGGENYLFPVDADVGDEKDARTALVSLNSFLADLSRNARNRIVILDACRNNPFAKKLERSLKVRAGGLSRGLARVYAGVGSFIAFSTQPGNVALDGTGQNSPFTASLLRHLPASSVDVHAVMRKVRADVRLATSSQQIPWENSSLIEEVSFSNGIQPPGSRTVTTAAPLVKERFHYVGGLDPSGDNFLALKSGPGIRFPRLATMGPNTLLKIIDERGSWKNVALPDGSNGWAHGKWIKCCKTVTRQAIVGSNAPKSPSNANCERLWYARNSIWHRYGYCFKGAKGKRIFGTAGCFRTQEQVRAIMSAPELKHVRSLLNQEVALGCR